MTEHTPHNPTHIHRLRHLPEEYRNSEYDISEDNSEVAAILLAVGSLSYYKNDKPYLLDSGILSPFYLDNRLLLSHPKERQIIVNHMTDKVVEIGIPDMIAGVATAGIPYAAIIADKLNLPMVYIRPEPKSHGMQKQLEGEVQLGQKTIIVEDQISTAGSSIRAVEVLRQQGSIVTDEFAIITRGTKQSENNFVNARIKLHTLTDLDCLLTVARETGYLNEAQIEVIEDWLKDPENWGNKMGFKS